MKRLLKGAQKTTPFMRLVPSTEIVLGIAKKTFIPDDVVRFCNFSTYGGTESMVNGLTVVENTAEIVAWYDPDITSADRIRILDTGADYEIIGDPENIEMRNQEMKFKIRKIKGGA